MTVNKISNHLLKLFDYIEMCMLDVDSEKGQELLHQIIIGFQYYREILRINRNVV